jgi:hypothetical protein
MMPFDVHAYRTEHMESANFLASPAIMDSTMWQHTSTGVEVVNEADLSPFMGIVVGRASPFRLKCGPAGNHINSDISSLAKAKYQFHLCHPAQHELAADYEAAINTVTMEALQNQVARTSQQKNMIIDDVTGKMVCCTMNIFTMRVCSLSFDTLMWLTVTIILSFCLLSFLVYVWACTYFSPSLPSSRYHRRCLGSWCF